MPMIIVPNKFDVPPKKEKARPDKEIQAKIPYILVDMFVPMTDLLYSTV